MRSLEPLRDFTRLRVKLPMTTPRGNPNKASVGMLGRFSFNSVQGRKKADKYFTFSPEDLADDGNRTPSNIGTCGMRLRVMTQQ